MLTKTILMTVALPVLALAVTKNYENFDLPSKARAVALPESKLSYSSSRVNVRGTRVTLKEPSVNYQTFFVAKEAFIAEKRDEAIKLLRQQMDTGLKANRDNMLLRLGQLYAEKYMELSYRENEYFGKQLQEYDNQKAVNKSLSSPRLDNSRSQKYLKDALGIFYSLEKEFPNHSRIDEVAYFIGFVELESGNSKKGLPYLERVVKKYPSSRKWEEAVLHVGDFYFENHKFKDASNRYKMLMTKNSSVRDYAEYKLAWCTLNAGEPKVALRNMKNLVLRLAKTDDSGKFNLRDQSLKDLVAFYGEAEDVEDAIDFFTKVQSKEKALENLRLIADIFRSKARDQAAIVAYQTLIKEFPEAEDTPRLYLGLYESQARMGKAAQATKTLMTALEKYSENSDWAKNYSPDKLADKTSTLENLASEAAKSAFFHHNAAQRSANRGHYDFALKIYSSLLKNFPSYPDRKRIAFFQGEALFNLQKWLDATNSYMVAAEILPKDKMNSEAVYNALLALDKLTASGGTLDRYSKEQQKNLNTTPEEIPAAERRFIEVGEFYIREYPSGDRVVDVQFRIASIYYRRHHFNEALDGFKKIALGQPGHRSSTTAAHIVLDIHNIKKDYDALNASAAEFSSVRQLGDKQFRAELSQIVGEIDFKRIEPLEKESKWSEAGETYLNFYKKNSTGSLAEKSLYNAYVSFKKQNDEVKASETARLFIVKFPNSEYTPKLMLSAAQLAEKQFDFDSAQKQYQEFYKKHPKDKEAKKALYNAAVYAELLEYNKLALNLYDTYLREANPSSSEKRAIDISQAKLYRKESKWEKSAAIYKKLVKESRSVEEKVGFLGELAKQYDRAGRVQEKNNIVGELRGIFESRKGLKANGPAVNYVAESYLKGLDKDRKKYEAIKLRFPPEDLLYLMKRKEKALSKLAKQYDAVIEKGVPEWGVAALYEKSNAYENYVIEYRSVKIPTKYKPEEKAEAESSLKQIDAKLVQPLEAKAQEILKSCAQRASEFHVVSEYADKCRSKIKRSENEFEPRGLVPQPAYWSTRGPIEGIAKK